MADTKSEQRMLSQSSKVGTKDAGDIMEQMGTISEGQNFTKELMKLLFTGAENDEGARLLRMGRALSAELERQWPTGTPGVSRRPLDGAHST